MAGVIWEMCELLIQERASMAKDWFLGLGGHCGKITFEISNEGDGLWFMG